MLDKYFEIRLLLAETHVGRKPLNCSDSTDGPGRGFRSPNEALALNLLEIHGGFLERVKDEQER